VQLSTIFKTGQRIHVELENSNKKNSDIITRIVGNAMCDECLFNAIIHIVEVLFTTARSSFIHTKMIKITIQRVLIKTSDHI